MGAEGKHEAASERKGMEYNQPKRERLFMWLRKKFTARLTEEKGPSLR